MQKGSPNISISYVEYTKLLKAQNGSDATTTAKDYFELFCFVKEDVKSTTYTIDAGSLTEDQSKKLNQNLILMLKLKVLYIKHQIFNSLSQMVQLKHFVLFY